MQYDIYISISISICYTLYHIYIYSYYTIGTRLHIYIYIRLYILDYIYCAQLKACCRLGGWNHQSGHKAMIFGDNCTQRSAIVFLTPGQLAGQMHSLRIHYLGAHAHGENWFATKYGPKNGVNFRTYNLFPSLLKTGFGGRWLVCETGLATSQLSFFFPLLPHHVGFNLCQTGFTTKGSSCWKFPSAIIIICDQHSYCDCRHTHSIYLYYTTYIILCISISYTSFPCVS